MISGSVEEVFKLLNCSEAPDGNRDLSFLTMISYEGLIFGVINIVGEFQIDLYMYIHVIKNGGIKNVAFIARLVIGMHQSLLNLANDKSTQYKE